MRGRTTNPFRSWVLGRPVPAAEFQKILDHSGIVWNCWTGALAHLGVARANALEAKAPQGADADAARVRALAAYRDFLTLWKDVDPDGSHPERSRGGIREAAKTCDRRRRFLIDGNRPS